MILTLFMSVLATASVVAGDTSARTTTSMGNTIATEHSHLMTRVLAGGSMSARSKFAHECNVLCGWYRIPSFLINPATCSWYH